MPELDHTTRRLIWTVYATPLMTFTTDLGLSIRVSMFEHVDWWLGPLSRSPGMGEGGDWWRWPRDVIVEGIPRVCQGLVDPISSGSLLSVFNKASTLKNRVVNWVLTTRLVQWLSCSRIFSTPEKKKERKIESQPARVLCERKPEKE